MGQLPTGMPAYPTLVTTDKATVTLIRNVRGIWFADIVRITDVMTISRALGGIATLRIVAFTDKYGYGV